MFFTNSQKKQNSPELMSFRSTIFSLVPFSRFRWVSFFCFSTERLSEKSRTSSVLFLRSPSSIRHDTESTTGSTCSDKLKKRHQSAIICLCDSRRKILNFLRSRYNFLSCVKRPLDIQSSVSEGTGGYVNSFKASPLHAWHSAL